MYLQFFCNSKQLTRGEKDLQVALLPRAGTDEEVGVPARNRRHLALTVFVILQSQAVELMSGVVAQRLHGDVVVFLPPEERENAALT